MVDIRFGEIKIDRLTNASGVFAGSNTLHGRRHRSKRNQAFGSVHGESNRFANLRTYIRDRDEVDLHAAGERREPPGPS